MLLPSLVPVTADAAIRNLFRALDAHEREILLTAPEARVGETKIAYLEVHRKILVHFMQVYQLAEGNQALFDDVKRRHPDANDMSDVLRLLFMRLLRRVWMEREPYPATLAEAAIILRAELSDGEHTWLMAEPLDEHGLLMRELVTWCMTRFGLEGENTALVDELTAVIEEDGSRYDPRLAARHVIQQLVLTGLADHPEIAAWVMQREHEKAGNAGSGNGAH